VSKKFLNEIYVFIMVNRPGLESLKIDLYYKNIKNIICEVKCNSV